MRIKKLELIGFKSFKDRTVIQFDEGITGIVGPNGCGKSNIVDALVWVMGEMSAKDLRGSQMTDVIFAGADGYAPLGMCEVSLTLENDGGPFPIKYLKFSEIMVTRRLHRSGEGEYFINKEPARLRDVQEIFMDTGAGSKGFSIIQQGMIGRIITAKPEDRKHLIEEAAGITKFKARKKESIRKLQATEQNLIRLQDILGELKRQMDSLHRQAQRAERYRNLKQQIEELDLWLSSRQYMDLKAAADEAQRVFYEAQSLEVEGESRLSTLQTELETLKLQILEKEKNLEVLQNMSFENQTLAQKKEMEIQELKFEIEQARRNEMMTGNLVQESKARLELLSRDQADMQTQVTDLESEALRLKSEFETKSSLFQEHQSRVTSVDEELTVQRRELIALGQADSALGAKIQSLEGQVMALESQVGESESRLVEAREQNHEIEKRRQRVQNELDRERQLQLDLSNDVESFEANKRILTESVQNKRQDLESVKDVLNEVTSRLYGLENLANQFEGFEEGVKTVMLWKKQRQTEMMADGSTHVMDVFQPVSEVVEVPPEYEVAMEAALGPRLQMILTSDYGSSLQAVDYLKAQKQGRSSFYRFEELDFIPDTQPAGQPGVRALLKDVVQASEKFQPAIQKLLGQIAVAESLSAALELRMQYPGWTFVTLDGDVLDSQGILTGGSSEAAESGLLKRNREIKELTERKNEAAGKLALAQAALKKTEEQLTNVVNDFEGAQKRKLEQEIKVTELKKDLERAQTEQENARMALERLERDHRRLSDQIETHQTQLGDWREQLHQLREKRQALEIDVQSKDQELQQTRRGIDELQTQVTELQVSSATKNQEWQSTVRQLELVTRQVNELTTQLSRMSEESEMYSEQMSESTMALEEKKLEFEKAVRLVEETKAELASRRNEYEIESARLRELESERDMFQTQRNQRVMAMSEAQLKLDQAKLKEQYLIDQVREKYMRVLPEIAPDIAAQGRDSYLVETELTELREKISKIGEVNLSAISEYEETSKRFEFLNKQHEDLTEAQDQLRKVIDRINRICSKRFKETFDQVNERFTKVFPVLFGGGEAKLEIHENTEKNEMGIEIIARPPGKKMQNVSLMSGGEKALTAVALVFSIFLVKPSPYCLLDEVDAPLDDANVFRFNDLVREMAKRSQIIVVTHNKHTMEVAKKLYGVTMQEKGVSTMVSVNLQDISA
ncbi:MAG: chromosome segregation protein SMC [Bdellovibrionales bacterium]